MIPRKDGVKLQTTRNTNSYSPLFGVQSISRSWCKGTTSFSGKSDSRASEHRSGVTARNEKQSRGSNAVYKPRNPREFRRVLDRCGQIVRNAGLLSVYEELVVKRKSLGRRTNQFSMARPRPVSLYTFHHDEQRFQAFRSWSSHLNEYTCPMGIAGGSMSQKFKGPKRQTATPQRTNYLRGEQRIRKDCGHDRAFRGSALTPKAFTV